MRSHYGKEAYRPRYWDEIPIELQVTVPVMWEGIARGIIRNAAKAAGFDKIVLRSEPLCAAARYIYKGWKAGRVKV
jgi:molecular chaperone DnaK (HSP70)